MLVLYYLSTCTSTSTPLSSLQGPREYHIKMYAFREWLWRGVVHSNNSKKIGIAYYVWWWWLYCKFSKSKRASFLFSAEAIYCETGLKAKSTVLFWRASSTIFVLFLWVILTNNNLPLPPPPAHGTRTLVPGSMLRSPRVGFVGGRVEPVWASQCVRQYQVQYLYL